MKNNILGRNKKKIFIKLGKTKIDEKGKGLGKIGGRKHEGVISGSERERRKLRLLK